MGCPTSRSLQTHQPASHAHPVAGDYLLFGVTFSATELGKMHSAERNKKPN